MFWYIIGRLNLFFITFLILSVISFYLLTLDLNASFTGDWLENWYVYLKQLNFFTSSGQSLISKELLQALYATSELCLLAIVLSLLIGIPCGILAGLRQNDTSDHFFSVFIIIGSSTPVWWIAVIVMMIFRPDQLSEQANEYIVLANLQDLDRELIENLWNYFVLPCVVLAITPTAQLLVLMRASVADIMRQNYINAAKIKGLSSFQIVRQHVLRNAMYSIITKMGANFSAMITLVIIIEYIFGRPGIGMSIFNSLEAKNYATLGVSILILSSISLLVNILADIIAVVINPQVKKEWYAK